MTPIRITGSARMSVLVIVCIVLNCVVQTLSLGCSDVVNGHVVVPSSIQSITSYAFSYCNALQTISFASPSQLRTIEDWAFPYSGLTAVIIPATVLTIGKVAFSKAGSLTSVTYNCSTGATPSRLSVGLNAFTDTPYAANGRAVPAASCRVVDLPLDCSAVVNGHVVVPSSIQSITRETFGNCKYQIKTISFASPSQLGTIDENAFSNSGLTAINIPATVRTIGRGAFQSANSLTSVTYNCSSGTTPSPLAVGVNAFMDTPYAANGRAVPAASCRVVDLPLDCTSIVDGHVVVPSSVRSITWDTFGNYKYQIKTISFAYPSQLRSIEYGAFYNSGLTAINLPASLRTIGERAFYGASSLTSVTYNCSTGTIPSRLSVGLDAFTDTPYAANGRAVPAASCRVVDFPFGCASVMDGHVVVPASVQSITRETFGFYCANLIKTISFASPSRLRTIEDNAFSNSGLTAIVLPASLQTIGPDAFSSARSLTSVTYNCSSGTTPSLLSVGVNAFARTPYAANGRAVPAASCRVVDFALGCSDVANGHVVVPSSVQSIKQNAFSFCHELTTISFASPSQVQTVEDNAFEYSGLTAIVLPASLQTIGKQAFKSAQSLTSVTYNCSTGTTPLRLSVGLNAFTNTPYAANGKALPAASCRVVDFTLGCSDVVNGHVVIPSSVQAITLSAFSSCNALKTIEFASPSQLRTIGQNAFYSSGLTAIILPASLRAIGSRAFAGASSLTSVIYNCSSGTTYSPLSADYYAFENTPYAANGMATPAASCRVVNLPLDCSAVKGGHVVVPSSVRSIKSYAFWHCYALKTISFASPSQMQTIEERAFSNSGLTAIVLPATVQTIGREAFSDVSSLTSVTYNCSTAATPLRLSVSLNAFTNTPYAANGRALPAASCRAVDLPLDCASVSGGNLLVPSSVQTISQGAFDNCNALKTISFASPSKLRTIEGGAFQNSAFLISVHLPASVQVVGQSAFYGASSMTSVTYECSNGTTSSPLSVGVNAFADTPYAANGRAVPATSCRVVNLPVDCSAVMNGNVVVPSSTYRIFPSSFYRCSALQTISFAFPSQLRLIDEYAFHDSGLNTIDLPSSVRFIGAGVFSEAISLASVTYNCSAGTTVSPLSVGVNAFENTPYAANGMATPAASCRVVNLPLDCSAVVDGHVVVPSSIRTIAEYSFDSCDALKTISFASPSRLRSIEYNAFSNSGLTAIILPASVQTIGEQAFSSAQSLTSVTYECSNGTTPLPLHLGLNAFADTPYASDGLAVPAASCRVVDLPVDCSAVVDGNVHIIKSRKALYAASSDWPGCTSVTSVTYDADSQLESIGRDIFRGSSLLSIRIPATVQLIDRRAFENSLLETVTYDCSDQPLFIASWAFKGTPYEANGLAIPAASCRRIDFALDPSIVHDGHLIVPAATTRIDGDSFEIDYVTVTYVTFEEGSLLKIIDDRSFDNLYITSIDIPTSVESIGNGAFNNSFALSSMTFSCSSHSLTIAANAFEGTALTSIALPPGAVYEGPVEVTALLCPTTGPMTCNAGQYLKNRGEINEACQACPAGKYTRANGNRKKKCPRCPHGTYQPEEGQTSCLTCPKGFRSHGQRGGPNCFHKKTHRPMRPSDLFGDPESPAPGVGPN